MARNILDSKATFIKQCADIGLSDSWTRAFCDSDLGTLGKVAYAVSMPGQPLQDELVASFLENVRPNVVPTLADLTAVKRLVFEAQTFQLASLKSTMAAGESDQAKRIAPAERAERIRRQRQQLVGLDLSGPLEPAFFLYDRFAAMLERDELEYISPNKCLTRQQELSGEKPDKQIQLDSSKAGLVVKDADHEKEVQITSDLALQQAMVRRNLAMDLVGLASFATLQKWTTRLFTMFQHAPPPGFQKVSQAQLLRFDRQAFLRLNELSAGSLKPDSAGKRALNDFIDSLHFDVSVTYFLLPIQSHGANASGPTSASPHVGTPKRPVIINREQRRRRSTRRAARARARLEGAIPRPRVFAEATPAPRTTDPSASTTTSTSAATRHAPGSTCAPCAARHTPRRSISDRRSLGRQSALQALR